MKWLDRTLWSCTHHIGLCVDQKSFERELKRMKVPRDSWPPYVPEGANACTHFFTASDGDRAAIVCIDPQEGKTGIQTAALLVHEAVHIWQEHLEDTGEEEPGAESEAYAIQRISQTLMEAYAKVRV